jgi:hypothetical protein
MAHAAHWVALVVPVPVLDVPVLVLVLVLVLGLVPVPEVPLSWPRGRQSRWSAAAGPRSAQRCHLG